MSASPKLMSPIPRLLLSKDVPLNVFQCPIMCLSPATLEGKGVQIYINQPRWKTNILNHTLTFSSLPAFKISGRLCFCHIGYSTDGCLILPNNSNFDDCRTIWHRTIWHRTIWHRTIWHQDNKADNLAPR